MLVPQIAPLSKLYCAVKPLKAARAETDNAEPQVFETTGVAGIAGNTVIPTGLLISIQAVPGE